MEGMVGQTAEVRQALDPVGMVLVDGELWRAERERAPDASGSGPIPVGERVIITGHDGYRLRVRRKSS
jgi:membrane protein implicated in regulation of membrane protease activity